MSNPISNRLPQTQQAYSSAPAAKPKAKYKSPDKFVSLEQTVGGSWQDQLAAVKVTLEAKESLGVSSAVNSKEAGEIIERVLSDTTPTEDLSVIADRQMAENGMVPEFTEEILKLVNAIPSAAAPDHAAVVDLRHLNMVSVDNGELDVKSGKLLNASKDIDQVEYAERMPNGNIKMMVGIADVDSLVKKGDLVDNQAMRQGATVYTDEKIFPMIAPKLSEDLTSLDEMVDRLAVIKEFQVTPQGEIVEPKVFRAYVHNRAQLAYESVNEFLTDGTGARPPQLQDPKLAEQMELQDEAAQRLRAYFHSKGSLDIESSEAHLHKVDNQVVGMSKDIQTRAKDKVKFNMMAANMSSMIVLDGAGMPTLRRIVKTPENWDRIKELAGEYNYKLPSDPNAAALNGFLEARKEANPGAHEELCSEVVRLVGRGEYVVATPGEPIEGHFALAVPDYGHTTAPNRRAPDLVNQRIEKAYAQGDECPYSQEELEVLAAHFNQQESAIKSVERRVHRSASAKLMKDKIGRSFDGHFQKEIPNGSLVRLDSPYVTGLMHQKPELKPGDDVRVTLEKVDVEKGFIDFALASEQSVDGFLLKE